MVKKIKPDLRVSIAGLSLKNPVSVASGTFGYAEEFDGFMNLSRLGSIVTKTVTERPREGNPPPRTCETPAGMLNSIGLENPGMDRFVREKLPFLERLGVPVILSISSEGDPEEFFSLARRADKLAAVSALEINISCPNVSGKGACKLIAQDPSMTAAVVRGVRKATGKPIITKLSPNVRDITEIALAAQGAGSDAVSLINTITGMAVDIRTKRSKLANVFGGLSGPAVKPVALRMVWEVARAVSVPVVAMGGIMDAEDALEFIICGATVVCCGTVNFIDPAAPAEVLEGIQRYMKERSLANMGQLRGSLKT